jgi:hypothetical protein
MLSFGMFMSTNWVPDLQPVLSCMTTWLAQPEKAQAEGLASALLQYKHRYTVFFSCRVRLVEFGVAGSCNLRL